MREAEPALGFDAVRRIVSVLASVAALAGCNGDGRDPVTLALDFQPNPAHAGIYAALRDDLDAEHGLDLRVRVPSSSTDSLALLAARRAELIRWLKEDRDRRQKKQRG